jgi:hypothetical protein
MLLRPKPTTSKRRSAAGNERGKRKAFGSYARPEFSRCPMQLSYILTFAFLLRKINTA